MRVILAGGSGLIGRSLIAPLTAERDEVVVLSRQPSRVKGLPPGARVAGWDGRTADAWQTLLDADTALVNLAGESIAAGRWTAERKRRIRDSRLAAAAAMVEAVRFAAAAGRPPAVLVQASAVGYYGDTGDEEVTEEHPPGADFMAELSVAWEEATEEVDVLGVRRVLLRTGLVLHPDGGALPAMVRPFRFGAGGRLGDGRQWMPWIHWLDEVDAIRFLLASPTARGAWNLTAPRPVRNGDFARALGRQLRRPSLLPAPAFALHLALGDMADALLHGQRALPHRLLAAGYRFHHPDLAAALRDLLGA
jgi:uncharacterized protein